MTRVATSTSNRVFTKLPIDPTLGFPQTFPMLFEGVNYHFYVYVNIEAPRGKPNRMLSGETGEADFIVRVQKEETDGVRRTIFQRKVLPGLEYETKTIVLRFSDLAVATSNLNGPGDHGSVVKGGIALRWA